MPPDLPNSNNLLFLESLWAQYLDDPSQVPSDRHAELEALFGSQQTFRSGPSFRARSVFAAPSRNGNSHIADEVNLPLLQDRVDQLVRFYRVRGHRHAQLDPLGRPRGSEAEFALQIFDLDESDLDREFSVDTIPGGENRSLREIVQHLQNTYCRSIGSEYMHIADLEPRWWLRERIENSDTRLRLDRDTQRRILTRLTDATIFEDFLRKKFVGAKSFSLEGGESLIPLLDLALEKAGDSGVTEVLLGMAHRGRLNVMANILGKSPQEIFHEFEDKDPHKYLGRGDVKYHLGYSSEWTTAQDHRLHVSLCFNPSHLGFVGPVAQGRTRAKQDRAEDATGGQGLAILIHGDAAFAGEGVSQEMFNMSALPGYSTGGTIHIVVNNQIGFTTTPDEARSSDYATSVARMLDIPIFHVNGEDPESVARVVDMAVEFRMKFRRDVVIDMYCYRRRGHNESDEPSYTQPDLYRIVRERQSVYHGYLDHLLKLGGVTAEEAEDIGQQRQKRLDAALDDVKSHEGQRVEPNWLHASWTGYAGGPEPADSPPTTVARQQLVHLTQKLVESPETFQVHPRLERLLAARLAMANEERPYDWGTAELLAIATLAIGGRRIRVSGQDSERGTFSQRHAVLHDFTNGDKYCALTQLSRDQAPVDIINSPLSEIGVLGFEYGYSLDSPDGLVIWEAQFGDFANVAQVIIDQFLSSGEDKWRRLSGLVLLLPHGFEGMGPEHSSARLERFLTLAAEDNMQIVYPSTPAQHFHLLRRQVLRNWRKPLVVMTPKSLLRLPEASSTLTELAEGSFRKVIPDDAVDPAKVRRILLTSGKVFYDIDKGRRERERDDVAIIRVEQLYPFPEADLRETLAAYADETPILWVQEEPENMGAWRFMRCRFLHRVFDRFPFSGCYRPESASPATGSAASHRLEQEMLMERAFGNNSNFDSHNEG